jgi:hypothetical protein
MPVSVILKFPPELMYRRNVKDRLFDAAKFVRDYWISISPHRSGEYAKGLMGPNVIKVGSGLITITNFAKHAGFFEAGHRSFNLAQRILAGGKGVKVSKDGFRYKVLKIPKTLSTQYRKPSLAASVQRAFGFKTPPAVMGKLAKAKPYVSPKRVSHSVKPKTAKGSREGIVVISEKTLRNNPQAWQIPAMVGRGLAKKVQDEAIPIINQAITQALTENQQTSRTPIGFKNPIRAGSKKPLIESTIRKRA